MLPSSKESKNCLENSMDMFLTKRQMKKGFFIFYFVRSDFRRFENARQKKINKEHPGSYTIAFDFSLETSSFWAL